LEGYLRESYLSTPISAYHLLNFASHPHPIAELLNLLPAHTHSWMSKLLQAQGLPHDKFADVARKLVFLVLMCIQQSMHTVKVGKFSSFPFAFMDYQYMKLTIRFTQITHHSRSQLKFL
jgi:hypothetical protein